jgi:RNA polymerase sigma-70 factor, ECF subfamily
MKVALNSHAVGSALRREAVALRNHIRRKTKRLLSKQASAPDQAPAAAKSRAKSFDGASLRETIRLAQQGDSSAFETVYRLYAGRVNALCLRMLHDPNLAEDALQDAFLQLFRKIQTFRGESAFSTWLHRLTVNVVLMRLRRTKPISVPLDEMVEGDNEESTPRHEIGGPDLQLTGLVDRVTLEAAIEQLPEGYKQMFILHDVQGFQHREIAEILGSSIGTSKSQLHKARKRLRELLQRAGSLQSGENKELASHSLTLAGT